ncbi:MAG TPA: patatin-like phospholipase family protein [Acidimicrobiales bacterium]|jgi:NTE family protein
MTTSYPFTNLVFEGGGVKGIAYAGALAVLAERDVLPRVTAVAGTSAGAITAALVAVGYTPEELTETMLALDLRKFEDGKLEGPVRLVEKYGFYKGEAFLDWMREQVAAKVGSPDATFADLAAQGRPDLRVVATDLATQVPRVFSPSTSPTVAVAHAVRMSMSIPFFFAAVQDEGSVYVDGGAVWNYPVEIFDTGGPNVATLGFRFENTSAAPRPPSHVGDVVEYVKALYEAMSMVQTDFYRRSGADVERTVVVDDLGIKATEFAITDDQKHELIARGRAATDAFLNAWTPATATA